MPQAEEAPPIPDALPEALVTPVAKPVGTEPAQRAKELPEPAAAAVPSGATADAVAAGHTQSKPRPPERLMDGANVAQQYCFNIADAAKDARYAWQKKTLADIEVELNKRIALLDERTAEYQKWLARRDEFIRNAEENVVKIYAGMKADAAAIQLALMYEESAAAVLAKLSTRNASAILNEMEPAKAAKLTMIITGAAKLKRKKELQKPLTTQGENVAPAGGPAAGQGEGGRS
jgi:flagellar motility protein MotE (MotC chaperone)